MDWTKEIMHDDTTKDSLRKIGQCLQGESTWTCHEKRIWNIYSGMHSAKYLDFGD